MPAHYSIYNFYISFIEKGNPNIQKIAISYSNSPVLIPAYLPKNVKTVLEKVKKDWGGRIVRFVELEIEIMKYELVTKRLLKKRMIKLHNCILF